MIHKLSRILSALSLLLLMAANCNLEPEPTPTPTPPPTPPAPTASITLSIPSTGPVSQTADGNAAATFEAGGGSVSLSFSATVAWTASSGATWCTVSPASGAAGSASVTLTAAKNETFNERTATVTLQAGTAKKTVTVKQPGQTPYITVEPEALTFDDKGGEYGVSVKSNASWRVSASAEWFTVTPAEGSGDGSVTVRAVENPLAANRNGQVVITTADGSVVKNITVIQTGKTGGDNEEIGYGGKIR
ncbi:MAG: BACON domain-containing protein [Bacteroidales bacterium]|jgi:uncharacterized protein YaiE (UPF0345 family)|nr:BACON domain-containing protein [Bacteroidales bacterium]